MSHRSDTDLLVLHAVRLRGMSSPAEVAARFALDPQATEELLLDEQACGRVTWSEFAGTGGWSLTDRGRHENERRLRAELDEVAGAMPTVAAVHEDFLPLNARLQRASTNWQIRPRSGQPLAGNDHTDLGWDGQVLAELDRLASALEPLVGQLTAVLARFEGYDLRFRTAQRRAAAGDRAAVTGVGHDSCHAVWFELHEDLIATLGLSRDG